MRISSCRQGFIALAAALVVAIAAPALAGPSGIPSEINDLISDRLEVRFINADGVQISGGELRVYDHAGSLVGTALPSQDGSYALGRSARGKLRFVFADQDVVKTLGLPVSGRVDGASAISAMVHPKVDYYASLMGVTPRVVWHAGDLQMAPDFSIDRPLDQEGAGRSLRLDRRSRLTDLSRVSEGKLEGDSGLAKDHLGNNECDDAISVSVPSTTIDDLPGGPTDSFGCAGTLSPGLWYEFTGAGNLVTASTSASPDCGLFCPDTIINVYSGDCSAPVCVAGDDDGGAGFTSEATFCAIAGQQYYVEVENWGGGDTGETFQLDLIDAGPGPTPNGGPSCEEAQPIQLGESIIGNNTCVDNTPGLPDCGLPFAGATGTNVLFYSVSGTGNPMTVSTSFDNTSLDTQIRVYCASCGPEPVCVAADDDSGTAGNIFSSETTFCSQPGAEYVIAVGGFGGEFGQFELQVTSTDDVYVTPSDICSPTGENAGDGQPNGAACSPVGAVCIKCLDEANCLEDLDAGVADRIAGKYLGNGVGCTELQGSALLAVQSSPGTPISSGAPSIIFDYIAVAEDVPINNLRVGLDIRHTWIGDLDITLQHVETGTTAKLWDNFCNLNDDLLLTFDDTLDDFFFCADSDSGGEFGVFPGNPLFNYIGESSQGSWELRVQDTAFGDGGALNSWNLQFDGRQRVLNCGPRNNGSGNGVDAQPGQSDNCNDCPG